MKSFALACCLLSVGWQQPSHAWGNEGHRITGYIANSLLTDATRAQLRALVGTDDVAQIATWMDDEREVLKQRLPDSSRWHYENRAVCDQASTVRPCPKGHCITQQIDRSTAVLANRGGPVAQRADALRILVHLLGDLHQPLHLVDNHDRGGNDVWVRIPREREPRRLHEVWDTRLVRMNANRRETVYTATLLARFQTERDSWASGTVAEWATDSFQLGKQHAYAPLPDFACRTTNATDTVVTALPASYIQNARAVIDEQLAKAGVRIATVLNRTVGMGNR